MRSPLASLLFPSLVLSTVAVGCNGARDATLDTSDAGTPSFEAGPPPVVLSVPKTASAACAAYGAAVCKRKARCTSEVFEHDEDTIAYCSERAAIRCAVTEQARGVALMPLACSAAIDAQSCDEPGEPTSCRREGALVDGTHCNFDSQCRSGECVGESVVLGDCGVCATLPPVTVAPERRPGETCEAGRPCALGYQCHAGLCVAKGLHEGAACSLPDQRTWCGPDLTCIEKRCAPPLRAGDACVANPFEDPCDVREHLWCEWSDATGSSHCAPRHPHEVGEDCLATRWCKAHATCAGPRLSPKCAARVADGAPCTREEGPDCAGPYSQCLHGVCTAFPPTQCE
jgi:hypothetical protein